MRPHLVPITVPSSTEIKESSSIILPGEIKLQNELVCSEISIILTLDVFLAHCRRQKLWEWGVILCWVTVSQARKILGIRQEHFFVVVFWMNEYFGTTPKFLEVIIHYWPYLLEDLYLLYDSMSCFSQPVIYYFKQGSKLGASNFPCIWYKNIGGLFIIVAMTATHFSKTTYFFPLYSLLLIFKLYKILVYLIINRSKVFWSSFF